MNTIISTSEHIARKDYICHGCGTETETKYHIPIKKGGIYFSVSVPLNGTIKTLRYCHRCHYAMNSKLLNSKEKTIDLSEGSLQWHRLSNSFRKRFSEYVATLIKWRDAKDAYTRESLNLKRREFEKEFSRFE